MSKKTKSLNVSLRKSLNMNSELAMNTNQSVTNVSSTKLLGVTLDSHLTFSEHVSEVRKAANRKIHGLLVLKQSGVNTETLVMMYRAQILPTITYSAPAWFPFLADYLRNELEKIQKLALRIIFNDLEHYIDRLNAAKLTPLCDLLYDVCSTFVLRIVNNPEHLLRNRLNNKTNVRPQRSVRKCQTDVYIKRSRTVKCSKAILKNKDYLA